MSRLRDAQKFSPHSRIIAAHTMGRAVMDVDGILVNFARGFVLHLEFKWMNERDIGAAQMANILMVAGVWSRAIYIERTMQTETGPQRHDLIWRGYYIFRAGENDELTNDHPWQLLIIYDDANTEQLSGDDGAVKALCDIALGKL